MNVAALSLAFTLGLLSTVHCWGMCGGLLLAFAPARAEIGGEIGDRPRFLGKRGLSPISPPIFPILGSVPNFADLVDVRLLGYNLGRLTSYTLAGAVTGGAAGVAFAGLLPAGGHRVLQGLAAAVLVLAGVALLQRLPGQVWLQRIGLAGWRRLQPLTRGLLPAHRFDQRFLLGMVWGWLPCGFVYSMLALAATQGSAPAGAATMFAFGLGTLPGMLAAQVGLTALRARVQRLHAPTLAAWLLIGSGVALLALQTPWRAAPHHHHGAASAARPADHAGHSGH